MRRRPCVQEAEQWQDRASSKQWHADFSWSSVYHGACAVMWLRTHEARYGDKLCYFACSHLEAENGIGRTPSGLTFVSKWGSNRHAAGVAAILACYADGLSEKGCENDAEPIMAFARSQVCHSVEAQIAAHVTRLM